MVEEARLETVQSGLAPVTAGWFVVNVGDAAWLNNDTFGGVCIFEADRWVIPEGGYVKPHAGFTIRVVVPGQPMDLYHLETDQQEDFLVLVGECLLVVEDEERPLRTWDFVHCPPGTGHVFVGAGDGPCVILGTGNRSENTTIMPRSEPALRHGAGVEVETTVFEHAKYGPWRLEHPPTWGGLPWT